jgi:hypothetical protein
MERKMSAPKKTALVTLAVMGALMGTAALAERGGMGMGGEGRGAMLLQMFDTIDANKDGKVTQEELAAHRAAEFAAADTNSDGALSAEELQAHMLAEMLARHSARMIENMDDDGNGSLSIDTDNDGAISKEEAEALAERMGKHRDGRGHGHDDN